MPIASSFVAVYYGIKGHWDYPPPANVSFWSYKDRSGHINNLSVRNRLLSIALPIITGWEALKFTKGLFVVTSIVPTVIAVVVSVVAFAIICSSCKNKKIFNRIQEIDKQLFGDKNISETTLEELIEERENLGKPLNDDQVREVLKRAVRECHFSFFKSFIEKRNIDKNILVKVAINNPLAQAKETHLNLIQYTMDVGTDDLVIELFKNDVTFFSGNEEVQKRSFVNLTMKPDLLDKLLSEPKFIAQIKARFGIQLSESNRAKLQNAERALPPNSDALKYVYLTMMNPFSNILSEYYAGRNKNARIDADPYKFD